MALISAQDLEDFFNPQGSAQKFQADRLTATALATILRAGETPVVGSLQEQYRRMKTTVCGLVLTREAAGGETTFSLPAVVRSATSGYVWVNHCGVYGDRKRTAAVEATFSATQVTLATALSEGDVAICDVYHDFSNPPEILKTYALNMAAYALVMKLPTLVDPAVRTEILEAGRLTLQVQLRDLAKGNTRIDEWDELDLVREHETVTPEGPGILIPDGW